MNKKLLNYFICLYENRIKSIENCGKVRGEDKKIIEG
jgi:hypothetical protein